MTEVKQSLRQLEIHLNMHRTASNETTLFSEIQNIINDENVIIAPGQGKKPISILSYEFLEEKAFLYHLPKAKFGYNALRDIPISSAWYFNQWLLNFNQYFASDADDIFLPGLCMSSTTYVHQ